MYVSIYVYVAFTVCVVFISNERSGDLLTIIRDLMDLWMFVCDIFFTYLYLCFHVCSLLLNRLDWSKAM